MIVLGGDYYESADSVSNTNATIARIGIGTHCHIENAIIDKNARIGNHVTDLPGRKPENADHALYFIRGKARRRSAITTSIASCWRTSTEPQPPPHANSTTTMYADIKVMIEWRPTSAITAQIGYQAMWIDQLALAARNFSYDVPTLTDAAAEPPINSRGTLIYQGPFAGLQLNW